MLTQIYGRVTKTVYIQLFKGDFSGATCGQASEDHYLHTPVHSAQARINNVVFNCELEVTPSPPAAPMNQDYTIIFPYTLTPKK